MPPSRLPPPRKYPERPPWDPRVDRGSVRVRIVDAAWNALLTRSMGEISFRDLAAEVGVSTPALYHHFPTLKALGEELANGAAAAVRGAMLDATEKHQSARAGLKAFLSFAARRPNHFALMLAPEYAQASNIVESFERFAAFFKQTLELDSGRPATETEARTLWVLMEGAGRLTAAGVVTERAAFDSLKRPLDLVTGRKR